MTKVFREGDLSFSYPDGWRLEKEEHDRGWTVAVYSPDTAFLTVSLDEAMPSPEQMTQTVLEALREDYPDLDADESLSTLAGQPAVGHDINFFSLDLTNTCWTRSFPTAQGTALLLFQVSDFDLDDYEPVFRAICASLSLEEDSD